MIRNNLKKIENVYEPVVDFSLFDSKLRNEGISGFMRLRNEAEFLAVSIDSWILYLDELIIVYNDCQDDTESIIQDYINKYPDKIKAFHYIPVVYPQGSELYKHLPSDHFQSLVNYYNFSLSKTTKKWAIKIDGDQVLVKGDKIREKYNQLKIDENNNYVQWLSGVNIIDHKGKLYIPSTARFCNLHGDLWLFRVDKDSIFKKGEEWEFLDLSKRTSLETIFVHYHLKFMKNDYGLSNYELKTNPNSRYYSVYLIFLAMLKLIPLEKIVFQIDMPIVNCEFFGVNRMRDYKKDARAYLSKQGGNFSLKSYIKEFYIYLKFNATISSFLRRFLRKFKH